MSFPRVAELVDAVVYQTIFQQGVGVRVPSRIILQPLNGLLFVYSLDFKTISGVCYIDICTDRAK